MQIGNGVRCNGDSSWADDWPVFVDIDRDGNIDADDTIVWTSSRPGELMRIVNRGFPGGTPRFVTFLPTGFTNEQNGTFYICDHRGAGPTREVVLYKTGRARRLGQSTADRARHCSKDRCLTVWEGLRSIRAFARRPTARFSFPGSSVGRASDC